MREKGVTTTEITEADERTFSRITIRRRIRPKIKEELQKRKTHDELHRRQRVELAREDAQEQRAEEEALDLDPLAPEHLDGEERRVVPGDEAQDGDDDVSGGDAEEAVPR